MSQPNYSQLLQTVWYGADAPNDSETNSMPSQVTPDAQPTDVLDVLGDSIAWEHTFPGVTADLESFPDTIPAELVTALHAQGITGLYSHQVKTYRAVRAGKDVILTPPALVSQEMKFLNPLPVSISSRVIALLTNPIAIAGVVPFPNPQWGRTQL